MVGSGVDVGVGSTVGSGVGVSTIGVSVGGMKTGTSVGGITSTMVCCGCGWGNLWADDGGHEGGAAARGCLRGYETFGVAGGAAVRRPDLELAGEDVAFADLQGPAATA